MAKHREWTVDEFVAHVRMAHREWARLPRKQRPLFNQTYLKHHGLEVAMRRLRQENQIYDIIRYGAPEVVSDFTVGNCHWDRPRIETVFQECFAEWQAHGDGRPWCREFMSGNGGRNMLRALHHDGLEPEAYLRNMGGEIFARWVKLKNPWSRERAKELLRDAHRRWQRDERYGDPAGRRFNAYYLERIGHQSLLFSIRRHHSRGLDDFVRQIRDIRHDWSYRRRRSNREVGALVHSLYIRWQRDPAGRMVRLPFGQKYLRRHGYRGLIDLIRRRGWQRILPGRRNRAVREAWGKRIRAG